MRPIDADVLFDKAFEVWGTEADGGETNLFMEMINDAPTIAPPSNDPLTLEDLEGMIGEPLYVIPAEKDPDWNPCWVICMEDYILVHSTTNESRVYLLRRNEDYGKTWLAYRHNPEEGAR